MQAWIDKLSHNYRLWLDVHYPENSPERQALGALVALLPSLEMVGIYRTDDTAFGNIWYLRSGETLITMNQLSLHNFRVEFAQSGRLFAVWLILDGTVYAQGTN